MAQVHGRGNVAADGGFCRRTRCLHAIANIANRHISIAGSVVRPYGYVCPTARTNTLVQECCCSVIPCAVHAHVEGIGHVAVVRAVSVFRPRVIDPVVASVVIQPRRSRGDASICKHTDHHKHHRGYQYMIYPFHVLSSSFSILLIKYDYLSIIAAILHPSSAKQQKGNTCRK